MSCLDAGPHMRRQQPTHRDTPPEDVRSDHGGSPGSRVPAAAWPCLCMCAPVDVPDSRSPLTVAGAAPAEPFRPSGLPLSLRPTRRWGAKTVIHVYMVGRFPDESTQFYL